jgi:hypothetical protein
LCRVVVAGLAVSMGVDAHRFLGWHTLALALAIVVHLTCMYQCKHSDRM